MGAGNGAHCGDKQCLSVQHSHPLPAWGNEKTALGTKSRPPTWYCRETDSRCQPRQRESRVGIQAQLHVLAQNGSSTGAGVPPALFQTKHKKHPQLSSNSR